MIGSILATFLLVTISFATTVSSNTVNVEKKESPLFRLRTTRATAEKISKIIENIKTKFVGEHIFFLPLQWMINEDTFPVNSKGKRTYFAAPCTWEFMIPTCRIDPPWC